jgi:serine/threonine protein kinase/WD40 repeat protein
MNNNRPETAAARCTSAAELLNLFEEAWQRGAPLRIEDLLASPAARQSANRRQLLEELISIDLEYRWRAQRSATGGATDSFRLEEYARRYAELGRPDQLPLELVGQEYRVRQCWGDRPGHPEYAARFPGHGQRLQELLKRIDGELSAEFGRDRRGLVVAAPVPSTPRTAAVATAPVISLEETLRSQQLLPAPQLTELERGLSRRYPQPLELARELLRRGWLTPYQANLLLQGRGRDLGVGPYIILERLGEGGAGQVFKARHQQKGDVVALKVIRKELLADAETCARFRREIQVLSQLDHPNVVRALDAGSSGGTLYLALEFVEGSDLGRMVKQCGPLPVLQACAYMRQAALGLQHAHERGLVHRDIKPHNLIMSLRDGLIKVADLGLARLPRLNQLAADHTAGTGTLTPNNALIGTPDYMAPEQAIEFHNADIRADIYSLGCTFYYLLTGQPPFPGGTLAQTLLRHQQVAPPAIDKLRGDLLPGLGSVLARMLAKRPEDRYQSPAEVANALGSLSEQPAASSRRLPRVPWLSIGKLRHRWRPILAGTAVVLFLAVAWWLLFPSDERLRRGCIEAISERPGSPQALTAAQRLTQLPSPLDQLKNKNIPSELRVANLPAEVVAVLHPGGSPGEAFRVAFSLDGKTIASSGQDGLIHLWDTASAKKRRTLKGHVAAVRSLAFSPESTLLASGSEDRSLRLWDLATGSERPIQGKDVGEWDIVAFSLDGKSLLGGNRHGFVQVWALPALQRQCDFRSKQGIWSLALSPDGQTLALGGEQTLEYWTLPAGQQQSSHVLKTGRLLAYAPDGQAIAYIGAEAPTFRLRPVATGADVGLPLKQQLHSNPRFLGFTLDGKYLLTTIDDGTAIGWDTASKLQVGYWPMPGSSCSEAHGGGALAPDGRHLATPHKNGNVYIRRLFSAPQQ